MKHILKCVHCLNYTLKQICNKCGKRTIMSIPPKYSPIDKYGEYRRRAKKDDIHNKT